ncbi:MAG: hypothetical protein ACKO34_01085 [Vampirovibrionales bacterium]
MISPFTNLMPAITPVPAVGPRFDGQPQQTSLPTSGFLTQPSQGAVPQFGFNPMMQMQQQMMQMQQQMAMMQMSMMSMAQGSTGALNGLDMNAVFQPNGMNLMTGQFNSGTAGLTPDLAALLNIGTQIGSMPVMPQGMTPAMPQGVSQMMPQGMAPAMPQGVSPMMSQGMTPAMPQGMAPAAPLGQFQAGQAGMDTGLACLLNASSASQNLGQQVLANGFNTNQTVASNAQGIPMLGGVMNEQAANIVAEINDSLIQRYRINPTDPTAVKGLNQVLTAIKSLTANGSQLPPRLVQQLQLVQAATAGVNPQQQQALAGLMG